jgi:hypothetical protein
LPPPERGFMMMNGRDGGPARRSRSLTAMSRAASSAGRQGQHVEPAAAAEGNWEHAPDRAPPLTDPPGALDPQDWDLRRAPPTRATHFVPRSPVSPRMPHPQHRAGASTMIATTQTKDAIRPLGVSVAGRRHLHHADAACLTSASTRQPHAVRATGWWGPGRRAGAPCPPLSARPRAGDGEGSLPGWNLPLRARRLDGHDTAIPLTQKAISPSKGMEQPN